MKSLGVVGAFVVFLASSQVLAYANFIGYGHTSCIACHYNPFGNGPINDYGRAVWAVDMADRIFQSGDDEELGRRSGVLGTATLPRWWRPSAGYRGLWLSRSIEKKQPKDRYITMQADFSNVLKFGPHDDVLVVATVGYAPKPSEARPGDPAAQSNVISREHYMSVLVTRQWRVAAGMTDKVFGLRIPDHETFARSETELAQNDQTHGVVNYFNLGNLGEAGLHVFTGNLFQAAELRHKGASGTIEFNVGSQARVGASLLSSKNDFVMRHMGSVHGRFGVGHGSSLITEVGTIQNTPQNQARRISAYGLLQSMVRLSRGLHLLNTVEYFATDTETMETQQLRYLPGIQYFPAQRLELRIEAMNSRFVSRDSSTPDTWDLMGQLHVYF